MPFRLHYLDSQSALTPAPYQTVLAVRDRHASIVNPITKEPIVRNGKPAKEKRYLYSLDCWNGANWLHDGGGRYEAYFTIPPRLDDAWRDLGNTSRELWPEEGQRFVLWLPQDTPGGEYLYQVAAGIHLGRYVMGEHGLVVQIYRRACTDAFRWIPVPSHAVECWAPLPKYQSQQ